MKTGFLQYIFYSVRKCHSNKLRVGHQHVLGGPARAAEVPPLHRALEVVVRTGDGVLDGLRLQGGARAVGEGEGAQPRGIHGHDQHVGGVGGDGGGELPHQVGGVVVRGHAVVVAVP